MIIFPAIDIKNGSCVRLYKGDMNTAEKVADDFLSAANSFYSCGAKWIHMVDLDGAVKGEKVNSDIFTTVAEKTGLCVELGGGIRTMADVEYYLSRGISRVIIGSAALKNPDLVREAAKKYGVSESLLKAVAKAESNFNPNDVSSAGAIGVMQLMPSTAKELGVTNPYDAEQNIMGGAKLIAAHLKKFNGDVRLALAVYNAGSGAVKKYGGVPSFCKTYVNRVLSYKKAYETANAVG